MEKFFNCDYSIMIEHFHSEQIEKPTGRFILKKTLSFCNMWQIFFPIR